ncbi:hypothetical protein LRS74_32900 [Streptomyces sp. LX-29]|uniref:hypothetical protein n=1 Tax=Streptomyces sp. LX-29 TaxID=2900152 RepID=UPI00240D6DF3|nr:hypothetical protein [Streptomyces sp. LX-29]WFB11303.1 hypothetical protein LRS74_32900 [Streptomyces sp. LX-29]
MLLTSVAGPGRAGLVGGLAVILVGQLDQRNPRGPVALYRQRLGRSVFGHSDHVMVGGELVERVLDGVVTEAVPNRNEPNRTESTRSVVCGQGRSQAVAGSVDVAFGGRWGG